MFDINGLLAVINGDFIPDSVFYTMVLYVGFNGGVWWGFLRSHRTRIEI